MGVVLYFFPWLGVMLALALPFAPRPWLARTTAGLFAVVGVLMPLYVAGEDSYRHDGRSRWTVYQVHEVTVVAITAAFVTAGLAATQRNNAVWAVPVAALITAMACMFAFAGMSN